MAELFASVMAFLGGKAASFGSQACIMWYVDEPKIPESLIK